MKKVYIAILGIFVLILVSLSLNHCFTTRVLIDDQDIGRTFIWEPNEQGEYTASQYVYADHGKVIKVDIHFTYQRDETDHLMFEIRSIFSNAIQNHFFGRFYKHRTGYVNPVVQEGGNVAFQYHIDYTMSVGVKVGNEPVGRDYQLQLDGIMKIAPFL